MHQGVIEVPDRGGRDPRFATHFHVKGLDLRTIGLTLMIVGVIGLIIAIWQWVVWSRRSRQSEVLVDDRRYGEAPRRDYREPPG